MQFAFAPANTLDLRGATLREAEDATSSFLGRLRMRGDLHGYVLHGHGTGALKQGLRAWLKGQREVRAAAPAPAEEGGDAFTLVEIKSAL